MYELPTSILEKIRDYTSEELDYKNIEHLKEQLSKIQTIRYELSYERCNLYKHLLKERERFRIPRDKEYTEFDRKTMLQSGTSNIEKDYEFILSLEKIVESQIELGITFLQS